MVSTNSPSLARSSEPRICQLTVPGCVSSHRRHDLVQNLVKAARARAKDRGHSISDSVADRLTETLDAALIDHGAAQLLRSGRLTSALRHVGFGVVNETRSTSRVPADEAQDRRSPPAKAPAKRPARPQRATGDRAVDRRRSELRTRVEEAEAEYTEAETERAEAESLLDANQHQVADMKTTIDRPTHELDQARQQLKNAQRQTARLERALDRASRTAGVAQRRRGGPESGTWRVGLEVRSTRWDPRTNHWRRLARHRVGDPPKGPWPAPRVDAIEAVAAKYAAD